jgi:hypothetical protein
MVYALYFLTIIWLLDPLAVSTSPLPRPLGGGVQRNQDLGTSSPDPEGSDGADNIEACRGECGRTYAGDLLVSVVFSARKSHLFGVSP